MARTRSIVKVPLFGQVNKAAKLEDGATVGAQIGADLLMPDGSVATIAALAAAIGVTAATSTSVAAPSSISATIWSLIQEIPPNVVQVASLSTSGLVVRRSTGAWITRAIAVASTARLTITNGDGDAGAPTLDIADIAALSIWGRAAGSTGKPAPIASSSDDTFPQRIAGAVVWGGLTLPMIPASLITYAKLQDASAVSVLGRSANSVGVLADIVAAANDRLFARVGNALLFTQLTAGMFPAAVVPDAALSTNVPLLNAPRNAFTGRLSTGGFTVATLPAGTVGDRAYVTDATAPVFLVAVVGGGAVTCPVFYDGAAWVAG